MNTCAGYTSEYAIFLEQDVLTYCGSFMQSLALWLAVHYVFNVDYSKEGMNVGRFIQQFVFELPLDGITKGGTYISIASDIMQHRTVASCNM